MDDKYSTYSKKKSLRGYGGLHKSLTDRDFQESEVWDAYNDHEDFPPEKSTISQLQKSASQSRKPQSSLARMITRPNNVTHPAKASQHSVPVSIPDWSKIYGQNSSRTPSSHYAYEDDSANENSDADEVYDLPPHEWLDRKLSRRQMSSFSVVEGVGRTLKGRDLSKVRNSILTRTGFLE